MTGEPQSVTLSVNGRARDLRVAPSTTVLDAVREKLALTGSKRGCNQGVCGACTVLLDGRPVRGCLSLAIACEGAEITTIEGIADGADLHAVQAALVEAGAVQCGFCTPGIVLSAKALLDTNPDPTADEVRAGLSGNICRCSGYRKIIDAVLLAAKKGRGDA